MSAVSTRATLRHFGGPSISLQEYKNYFTLPVWKFYRRYIPKKYSIDEIDRYYFDHFTSHAPRARPFKQVKELLSYAHQSGFKIFIFSTVRQSILNTLCERYGFEKYITHVEGDVRDKEKSLAPFIKKQKLNPKSTIYLGDTDHDVWAAKKSKVWSAVVLCGYQSQERLLGCAPDFVWNDLGGMRKFLGSLSHSPQPPLILRGGEGFPIATVGALIFNQGDVFLVQTHKWNHTFGIPGGKIKYGESSVAALKREIREETGFSLKNIRWACVHDSIRSKEFYKKDSHFLLMNYYAETNSRNFRLNDESESGFWVHPKTALRLNLNQPTRVLLEHFLKKKEL